MKKLLIVVAIIVVLGGGYILASNKSQPAQMTQATPTVAASEAPSPSEAMMKKTEAVVTLTENGFEPEVMTVKAGERIVWTNKSGAMSTVHSNPHPIHTDYKPLNLGKFDQDVTLEFTTTEPGTYKYHDHMHPNKTGTVIVQ